LELKGKLHEKLSVIFKYKLLHDIEKLTIQCNPQISKGSHKIRKLKVSFTATFQTVSHPPYTIYHIFHIPFKKEKRFF